MKQLVQLQQQYHEFQSAGCEIIAVFREEKDGKDGLKKSLERTRAEYPLLLDTPPEATKSYSPDGFHTYIIDPAGVVRVDLPGTKMKRPDAEEILAALQEAETQQRKTESAAE